MNITTDAANAADISLPLSESSAVADDSFYDDDTFNAAFLAGALMSESHLLPSYHSVAGKPLFGLIWDPGASEALSGTQTILEYSQSILSPAGGRAPRSASATLSRACRELQLVQKSFRTLSNLWRTSQAWLRTASGADGGCRHGSREQLDAAT